jgi:hypothetical protein
MFNLIFKTMKKINLLLIITLTVLVFNCKKDEKATTPISKKDLLTGKSWILSAETVSPPMNVSGTLISDLFSQMDACDKDDIGRFNSNGTYTIEEGLTKCNANDPQVFETGTWTFNSDETILVMTSGSSISNAKIQTLTATQLIVIEEETYNSIKYTLTLTYKPI